MTSEGSSLRVALVMGPMIQEQTNVWAACSDHGTDITIIGTDMNPYTAWNWQPSMPERVKSVVLRPAIPSLKRGPQMWTYRGLGRALRRIRPDVIHVESEPWGGLALQAILDNKVLRLGAAVCVHGSDSIYWHGSRSKQALRRGILRVSLKQIDGFVSRNEAGLRLAREAGLKRSTPAQVIPAVVPDPEVFHPATAEQRVSIRRKLGLPEDEVIVAYVGRLREEKGVRDLVQALETIRENQPFLAVWGIGYLSPFVEEAFSSGAIRGCFGGVLDRPDVADALRASDILVVPSLTTDSWREHFGRIALEGFFSGAAVVAYASGALPEVVGDGGILLKEGDIEELARSIDGLVTDERLRLDLSERGRARALARYTPMVVAKDLIDFWSKVVRN